MSTSADLMIAAPSYAGWDILRRRASDPRSLAEETVLTAGGGPHAQGCLAGGGLARAVHPNIAMDCFLAHHVRHHNSQGLHTGLQAVARGHRLVHEGRNCGWPPYAKMLIGAWSAWSLAIVDANADDAAAGCSSTAPVFVARLRCTWFCRRSWLCFLVLPSEHSWSPFQWPTCPQTAQVVVFLRSAMLQDDLLSPCDG